MVRLFQKIGSLLPEHAPEFLYTVILRPFPLRQITNAVLRAVVPEHITRNNVIVCLNAHDPVISGALAFGVYERRETTFLEKHCTSGMVFLDVGANIGYYTAVAGSLVGPQGTVISLEPDPENYSFLKKTIARNAFSHVHAIQAAASSVAGKTKLFLSEDNRGDHRLYSDNPEATSVEVETVVPDSLIEKFAPAEKPLFIKIDVQGFEGSVVAGLSQTLEERKEITLLMEFWPEGLRSAGSDPLAILASIKDHGLQLFELADTEGNLQPIEDLEAFTKRFTGRQYTNVIGIKKCK